MAFVSQELKAKLAPKIKAVCAAHGVKATLAVHHHSTLVLNIKSGSIDFFAEGVPSEFAPKEREKFYSQVNEFHIENHWTGRARAFLLEVKAAMDEGNWDRSDSMVDHFDVGWYVSINVGSWSKPYVLTPGVASKRARPVVAAPAAVEAPKAPPVTLLVPAPFPVFALGRA